MLHQTHHSPWIHRLGAAATTLLLPHVASASVGAGAGLPYEDTFSKIVTSLTGPWAWTVAVVCVLIFAWRTIERGGDLGGSTMAFLGPAFICTLLLGSKKLMGFFGQGAMLTGGSSSLLALSAVFQLGVVIGMLMTACFAWRQHRRHEQHLLMLTASARPAMVALEESTDERWKPRYIFHTPRFIPVGKEQAEAEREQWMAKACSLRDQTSSSSNHDGAAQDAESIDAAALGTQDSTASAPPAPVKPPEDKSTGEV